MVLGEVLDARPRDDEVVEVHDRGRAVVARDRRPSDLHVRLVDGEQVEVARLPVLRLEPRLDDQDSARLEVGGHRGHGGPQLRLRARVADRREEAGDGVEAPAEIERGHVAVVERDARQPLACDLEEPFVEVEPGHVRVAVAELGQVLSGSARHVEERARVRLALPDQLIHASRLAGVVLEPVDEVVELGRAVEHGTIEPWRSIREWTSATST